MERTLLEYADCRGLSLAVDNETGVIRGVKILGIESRNGRRYSSAALEQARELYEGAKVNVNHPKGNPLGPREYQDRIGVIRNATFVAESGLFGDLHFNPRHALAGQLEWDARHAPENVGLSHNVLAQTTKRDERVIVEAITKVVSVDLVADPATTHGLFEELDPATSERVQSTLTDVTPELLREQRPDLVAALQEELRGELERVREEAAALKSENALQSKRLKCESLVKEYGLHSTESLIEALLSVADETAMRRILHGRANALAQNVNEPFGPRSREQRTVEGRAPLAADAASFVRLISG